MQLNLRYNSSTHPINLPPDANVAVLQEAILNLLSIPIEAQKIIFRGKPLTQTNQELSSFKISNGAKLLLLASQPPSSNSKHLSPQKNVHFNGFPQFNQLPELDQEILAAGPPEGTMKNYIAEVTVFPKTPFVVKTSKGVAKMQIETEALFFQYDDGGYDRIFYSDVKNYNFAQLKKDDYLHLRLSMQNEKEIIYFLPCQYAGAFQNLFRRY
ncbi:hypothetical protein TRFO_04808 [Tritrichomonas foetus]|uniref:Ubiquitin-like domain-containing protein n=1 Tax=Tritrichomonas foetus TaxID=1144522 RepID=A0A1J4KCQ5_9EUKA|nr:hypothetical protein TRFO_04808 [Tritrichomonas foetus]|eukprot:OHT08720.1 hypothetical protein TRFO_04808 [Tritrichomonas foetus]